MMNSADTSLSEEPMPEEDFEDLNVANLTETKSHRAATSETVPYYSIPQNRPRMNWAGVALFGALGALIGVAVIVSRRILSSTR